MEPEQKARTSELKLIPLTLIKPSPSQPRTNFDEEPLKELADSIKEGNIIQPIIVRKNGETYEIIAGERRWRAAKIAGIKEIPCIVKYLEASKVLIESLIENLHRTDLSDVERENAIWDLWQRRYSLGFKTKSDLAKAIGVNSQKVEMDIEAWEFRQREIGIPPSTPTYIISRTHGLPAEERKAIIEKVNRGEMQAKEAYKAIKVLRTAPEPLKKAIMNGSIQPDVAEEIVDLKQPRVRERAIEMAKTGIYSSDGLRARIERLETPKNELPTASLSEQIFNKTKWNLDRIGTYDFYTIGYENKSSEQLVTLLKCKNVKTLIDVRKNPVSMYKADFNKDNLGSLLLRNGIEYVHLPSLGVPSEIRGQLSVTRDYDWFFKWYDANIIATDAFQSLNIKDFRFPIAIMCVEFDPTKCHRHRLSLELEKRGLKGYDL